MSSSSLSVVVLLILGSFAFQVPPSDIEEPAASKLPSSPVAPLAAEEKVVAPPRPPGIVFSAPSQCLFDVLF